MSFRWPEEILLNPAWPQVDRERLIELVSEILKTHPLPNHLWVASSGSSARSLSDVKMIALSRDALLASARAVNVHLQSDSTDCWIQALPGFHVGGLGIDIRAYLSGARVVSLSGKWSAEKFYDLCESINEKANFSVGNILSALVPTQIYDLIQLQKTAPKSLRAIIVGGAALDEKIYFKARELGWPLLPSFGMTECCSQVATASLSSLDQISDNLSDTKSNLVVSLPNLQVLPHVQVKMGLNNKLSIQSPSLLTGYAQWQDGKAVYLSLSDLASSNGLDPDWFQTEDLVEIVNASGESLIQNSNEIVGDRLLGTNSLSNAVSKDIFLKPLGRDSDFVKILGEGVSLSVIRNKWQTTAEVVLQEAKQNMKMDTQNFSAELQSMTVVALPDERQGFYLCAVAPSAMLSDEIAEKILSKYNQQAVAYERIRKVVLLDQIPRTDLGKIAFEKLKSIITE